MLNDQSIISRTYTRDGGIVRLHVKENYFFLPHLSGLPHLLGAPHFHVNRPWDCQKNNLSYASFFFCTFLCRHCMTMTSNCLISRFVEDVNARQWLFVLLNFGTVFQNSTPEKFANIFWNERGEISAIKFEAVLIRFSSSLQRICCCWDYLFSMSMSTLEHF